MSSESGSSTADPSGQPPAHNVEVERPPVTGWTYFTIVPVIGDAEPAGGPAGCEGVYDVSFVLGVPGVSSVATSMDVQTMLASGDSLLASGDMQVALAASDGSSQSTWLLRANRDGRLGLAQVSLNVGGFAEAETVAYNQVMPLLSRLAFEANVGVEANAVVIVERATGTLRIGANLVGMVRPTTEASGLMTPDLGRLLATYREGLNSTAPLYQALSFLQGHGRGHYPPHQTGANGTEGRGSASS